MPRSGRVGDSITLILAACSATVAVVGVTFSSALGGTASAASRPEVGIAAQPTATWLTNGSAATTVQRVVASATAAHQVPVLVTYYLPGRDCGGYSSGGASSNAQYLSWLSAIGSQLGNQPAIVIVEPDAVALAASRSCSAATQGSWRSLLASAVSTLKRDRNAKVYLDAGNSGWVANQLVLATELKASGLASADGFALNVSNFHTVTDNSRYGSALSAAVGGAHFVIATSRNGAGSLPANSGYRGPSWCNPPGRALGPNPTTQTGLPLVDAYLWIKYPGASDDSCGLGDPAAGVFWPAYAIGLASRG
ncbi:MAG: glycoside hydrolase family 6 protein [Jatrophihabitantaceae bacterium]